MLWGENANHHAIMQDYSVWIWLNQWSDRAQMYQSDPLFVQLQVPRSWWDLKEQSQFPVYYDWQQETMKMRPGSWFQSPLHVYFSNALVVGKRMTNSHQMRDEIWVNENLFRNVQIYLVPKTNKPKLLVIKKLLEKNHFKFEGKGDRIVLVTVTVLSFSFLVGSWFSDKKRRSFSPFQKPRRRQWGYGR